MNIYPTKRTLIKQFKYGVSALSVFDLEKYVLGWNNRTLSGKGHCPVRKETVWVRLQYQGIDHDKNWLWDGIEKSNQIPIINKPKYLRHTDWQNDSYYWRADVMTYLSQKTISKTANLKKPIDLSSNWLNNIDQSLNTLAKVNTNRNTISQDRFSERLSDLKDDEIDFKITKWNTIHSDLHWGNISLDNGIIFDWEAWGKGPCGFDQAFLYCYSLYMPKVARKVYKKFKSVLESPHGIVCRLFTISKMQKMIEQYGVYPEMKEVLPEAKNKALSQFYKI